MSWSGFKIKKTVIAYLLLYMQIQLILYSQSTYPEIAILQLILYMQHAGPNFHLGALSCLKFELFSTHAERLAIDVNQISTTRARCIHWTSRSNS